MKKGDLVTIIDPMKIYTSYESLAKKMGLNDWVSKRFKNVPIKKGDKGYIRCKHRHLAHNTMVYAIDFSHGVYLFGEDGIEVKNSYQKYKSKLRI